MQAGQGAKDARFQVIRELGAGGMGTVALVEDRIRGQRAAVKRLIGTSSRALRALKHEFRAVEALRHPHLVAPYELGEDEAGLYLLMELVEGVDLFSHCQGERDANDQAGPTRVETLLEACQLRTAPSYDLYTPRDVRPHTLLTLKGERPPGTAGLEPHTAAPPLSTAGLARLERALPQLVSALSYLHERGLVHRDLKPANVLVDRNERVKLLDFGILSERDARAGGIQGTVAYLAPEHIRGAAPVPESDLYALGVMLYEIVSGRLPFWETDTEGMLFQHVHATPAALRSRAPDCPEWLADAIDALLVKEPSARLTLGELRARLPTPWLEPEDAAPREGELVGREAEQAELQSVLSAVAAGGFRFVSLGGASGVGKTALLEWFERDAARRGVPRLSARARFSERVPFNAVDGLVDGLSALLEGAGPRDRAFADLLARAGSVFPVLSEQPAPEPALHRAAAFDALVQLMAVLAREHGALLLCCDDLQWADADSVDLLTRLCLLRPASVALVATVREDNHSAPFARFWRRARPDLHLALAPLGPRALTALVAKLSARPESDVSDVAEACQGSPFLAGLSGRMLSRGDFHASDARDPLGRLLRELAAPDDEPARALLGLLVAVDSEITLGRLSALTGTSLGATDDTLAPLRHQQLVRAQGAFGPERRYDLAHDRVRRALCDHLSSEELRAAHAALALELAAREAKAAERVRHLVGSGQHAEAGRLALTGAREAEEARAFGLAAELYAIALAHGPREARGPLHRARALSLERSGRYLEAASEWAVLAERGYGDAKLDALLHQAKALLATSHLSAGRRALNLALEAKVRSPWSRSLLASAVAVARFLAGPGRSTSRSAVPGVNREASDRDAFLGTMVGYFDPPAGLVHLLAARDGYLAAGQVTQAAEVDYVLAYVAYFGASGDRRTKLAERYTESARTRLGGEPSPALGRPHALALMVRGVRAQHRGEWDAAEQALEASILAYEAIGLRGSFEHQFSWVQRLQTSRHGQNVPQFARTLEAFARVAHEVEDSALACHLGFHESAYELLRGRPERALERASEAERSWPRDEPSYQRFLSRFYTLAPRIYLGDPGDGFLELEAHIRDHARFLPLRTMFAGDVLSVLATLEAQAFVAGHRRASLRRILRRAARAEKTPPLGRHQALRAAGQALWHAGKREQAEHWFWRAESLALGAGQHLDVAIARHGRGRLLGGHEGEALVQSAHEILEERGADVRLFGELVATGR